MGWIRNFIKESQILYPDISLTPYMVMAHLLLTNGNGFEMQNGNFVKTVKDTQGNIKTVSFKNYYTDIKFDKAIDETKVRVSIEDFDDESLLKPETWLYFISREEYAPFSDFSEDFYKLYYFNENTDRELLRVSIAILQALVKFIENIGDLDNIKPEIPVAKELYSRFVKSLPKIKKEINRLNSFFE